MEINVNLLGKEVEVDYKKRTIVAVDLTEGGNMRVAVTTDNYGAGYPLINSVFIDNLAVLGSHLKSLNWDWIDNSIVENQ